MAHNNLWFAAFSVALLLAMSAGATEYGAPSNQFKAYGGPFATGPAPLGLLGNSEFTMRDNRRPPYLGMNGWGWDSEDCNKGCAHSNR